MLRGMSVVKGISGQDPVLEFPSFNRTTDKQIRLKTLPSRAAKSFC